MSKGLLKQHFEGIAVKQLSAVETDTSRSNQHEFNGADSLKKILGSSRLERCPTAFLWLDDTGESISEDAFLTWYDARDRNPKRSEHRLYFPTTRVTEQAKEGDILFIATRSDKSLMVIIVPDNSTIGQQLIWLFGLENQLGPTFTAKGIEDKQDPSFRFIVRHIFEELGIEIKEPDVNKLDSLLEQFNGQFPTTREFSEFARNTFETSDPLTQPDLTLISWIEHETALFKRLEYLIVKEKIQEGFHKDNDVDIEGFIKFSLSVQNRRKSRAGLALENHLEFIFQSHGLVFERNAITEKRSKPDFLFPGEKAYHNSAFPIDELIMLGSKSTCKDRWRQVLVEAQKIERKHLLTMQPGISEQQTDEMEGARLQLVIPKELHVTYLPEQQKWLMDLMRFIEFVQNKQKTV